MTTQSVVVGHTTSNIHGDGHPRLRAPKWLVRHRVRRAMSFEGSNFGQELSPLNKFLVSRGDYAQVWAEQATAAGKITFGSRHETPISVPEGVQILGHRYIEAHGGKAGVTPARGFLVVQFEIDGFKLADVECHPLPKPARA